MLIDVIDVKVKNNYNLELSFNDGKRGIVNIKDIVPFKGVFAPLEDYKFFESVYINPDIGTICWKNGADIAPDSLYDQLT